MHEIQKKCMTNAWQINTWTCTWHNLKNMEGIWKIIWKITKSSTECPKRQTDANSLLQRCLQMPQWCQGSLNDASKMFSDASEMPCFGRSYLSGWIPGYLTRNYTAELLYQDKLVQRRLTVGKHTCTQYYQNTASNAASGSVTEL